MTGLLKNRSMPSATVIPQLPYTDVGRAADWLCRSFGATVRLRIADHRVQLNLGDGAVVVVRGDPARASLMVRVADVDAHHARAVDQGARILHPPTSYPYGERQYTAIDCGDHIWVFSQSIADVAPETWGGTPGLL